MNQRVYRGIGEEPDPITGCRRIRLERTTITGFSHMGEPGTSVTTWYLDGGGTYVTTAGTYRSAGTVAQAVPSRAQDVLDLARLASATQALAGSIAGHQGPPAAEQVAAWLKSYQGLQEWQKAARTRMVQSEGGVDAVGLMLRGLLAIRG